VKAQVRPGRPKSGVDQPPRVMVGFGLRPAEYDKLANTARECGVGIAAFCRQALEYYLEHLDTLDTI
jgi:hypothetical protein